MEEARTAALTACKLIKREGLYLSARPTEQRPRAEYEQPRPSYADSYRQHQYHHQRNQDDKPREIRVDYASTCRVCGCVVAVGSRANWLRGHGVWHLWCRRAA